MSQLRTNYAEKPEWPIINRFSAHIAVDITNNVTKEEFLLCYGTFTVLPDFWKFHAMKLRVENRFEFWKLDFNSEEWLAQNFMPHGAPAVQKDNDGVRRFVVWNMYQLHGDLGERMGLTRKVSTIASKIMRDRTHPNEPAKDAKGKTVQYYCLGDVCPNGYGILWRV